MNPFPRESKASPEQKMVERDEERRDRHEVQPEKKSTGEHIGFTGGDEAPKKYKSEGTAERREPGLIDMGNASRAVKFLNKSVERNEHSPMVCGFKNDHKTH